MVYVVKDTHRENALQIKLKRLRKVCMWAFARTSSQLLIRGFYTEIKFPKIADELFEWVWPFCAVYT